MLEVRHFGFMIPVWIWQEINKALIVQDIAVISSQVCNDTLEDYFKKITGGEGIA